MIADWTTPRPDLKGWRPRLKGDPETEDVMALYSACIPLLRVQPVIVEIGVANGRSLLWAAAELVRMGKTGARLYGIDPWLGPGDPRSGHSSMTYRTALRSISEHGTDDELQLVHLLREPSPDAFELFYQGTVDLVLIDGCHEYGAVREDILAAMRALHRPGILAGHDYTEQFPGVVKAVGELLGGLQLQRGTCWVVELRAN